MKKFLAAAAVLAAIVAPGAQALPGSVSVTSSATDVTCNGISTVTVTLQSVAPPPEEAPLDLVIAIDESGSLSAADFVREKQAAATFVNALDFTGGVRKVGVILFSVDARVVVPLSNNKASVIAQINAITQRGGGTNITDALRESRVMVTGAGSQPGAAKVLLLMTDGQNNLEVPAFPTEIALFKAIPGEIFAFGFGSGISVAQLNQIASDPDSTHVYDTPDTTELNTIAGDIAEQIQNPAATNLDLQALSAAAPFSYVPGSAVTSSTVAIPLAGGFHWTLPTLGTETQTVTFRVAHAGNVDGAFPALSTFSLAYLDGDLNPASLTVPSPTIAVGGCNDAPVADAGVDQSIALSGSPTSVVGMNGTGSSDPDPQDQLTYTWSIGGVDIGTGATPAVPLGIGTHVITLTVSDGRLSDTDEVTVTITDPSPPTVTPTVTGTLGNNGWYTSDVGIAWTVVDAESPAATTGCGPSSVTADTAAASFTCSATSAGGSDSETVTVKRDATAPVVAYAGNAGTYDVTDTIAITCTASDALSGLASSSCPGASGPATSFLGTNTLNATATDRAGNTGSATATFTVAVDVASVCELVERFVDQHGVANALCVKLRHDSLGAFENQVNAQRGKQLTNAEADLLIQLARLL